VNGGRFQEQACQECCCTASPITHGFPQELSEAPNKKLLTKLHNLEASEDEVIVSDCGLQDLSIKPFLDSLIS